MVKAAAKMGWIDEERIVGEMAVAAYRAGAQIYITTMRRSWQGSWMKGESADDKIGGIV